MNITGISLVALSLAAPVAVADDNLPPFDFSDQFYLANGINPAAILGRPTGTGPNSVIDNRANGPDFNNVRLLQQGAAFDHSGHPIFFSVTGLPNLASFLNNNAGREAREIADEYNVYEFPKAANARFIVFPKRQDLIADLRHGYFSNDPLGAWKINTVKYTAAATGTSQGRAKMAELAARNGTDNDGTPMIRTVSEIEDLRSRGLVLVEVPPPEGGPGFFRWFFCPVVEDPRDGAIAPDAHLDVTLGTSATQEFINLFNCLQQTGDDNCQRSGGCSADFDCDGDSGSDADIESFFTVMGGGACATCLSADFNGDGDSGTDADIESFFRVLGGGGC